MLAVTPHSVRIFSERLCPLFVTHISTASQLATGHKLCRRGLAKCIPATVDEAPKALPIYAWWTINCVDRYIVNPNSSIHSL